MVVRSEPNRPATAEEQEALKQLLDVATDLSKASLLSLLRQCGGDPNVAMEQLYTLASTADEGHMSRYGSSDMSIAIIDDDVPLDNLENDAEAPAAATADGDDGMAAAVPSGEYGGKWGSSPTGSDDEASAAQKRARERSHGQPSINTTGQISATYRRATISMGGIISLGDDLDGQPVYSFINEGIRYVDVPIAPGADARDGLVDAVIVKLDLAVMDDEEFKAVCDSWLLEDYSSSSDDSAAERDYDYGAGGEFTAPKKPKQARSDPTEFRAYLNALMNESPEERAKRIEQERLDDFLAQQLYEEELREFERQWPSAPAAPNTSNVAVPTAPPAATPAPAATTAEAYDHDHDARWKRWREPASSYAPVAAKPRKPRPPGGYHRPRTGPQTTVTVTTHRDLYAPRSIQVVLPAAVNAVAIQNIVNPALERRFTEAARKMHRLGYSTTVDIAYHGAENTATAAISRGGFIAPLGDAGASIAHRSGNNGFYGNGIYLTPNASVAQGYAAGNKIIVCNVLRGRPYKCPGLTMGAGLKAGYSSHESPCGSEWVFFSADQVLPVAIIYFGERSVGRPDVLATITSHEIADSTGLQLASANAELTRAVKAKRANYTVTPARAAQLQSVPAARLSNRDRKILNRIRKGKGLQQQTEQLGPRGRR